MVGLDETVLRTRGLGPKPTWILLYLVQHSERICGQKEIYRAVWEEEPLVMGRLVQYHITYIHRWLRDHPGNGEVKVYHKSGYRYVGPQ